MPGLPYKVLVVTSCTGNKYYSPKNMLSLEDFKEPDSLYRKEVELSKYKMPAIHMYTGKQHEYVVEGLNILRSNYGHSCIDLMIVSAGYGLLDENDLIVPYNASFSDMRTKDIIDWSRHLNIKENLEKAIQKYDLIIFLLGADYLKSLSLPVKAKHDQKLIFITGWSSSELIPDLDNYWLIGSSQKDATIYGSALVSLKGLLFKMVCMEITKDATELKSIFTDPEYLYCIFYRYRKDVIDKQLHLFEDSELPSFEEVASERIATSSKYRRKFAGFIVKEKDLAANYLAGKNLKYFIPEWDDRVDPDYDFINDLHKRDDKSPYEHDKYAHEIYAEPNYDGILVSLSVLDNNKKQTIDKEGVHNYLRFPNTYPIMADCGAFNYISHEEPPFKTTEVIKYYEQFGFDYGVSIDHLIVGDFERNHLAREKRYHLTQKNAEEFFKLVKAGNYSFTPIGVAQGWDPKSYRESVEKLIDIGYDYIALGSLIPKKSEQIYKILRAVAPILPEHLDVHLFGITRPEGIQSFYKFGATSFDSAGPLRQAWLSASSNYYTMQLASNSTVNFNGYKKYAALRIPFVNTKELEESLIAELGKLEKEALKAVRAFEKRLIGLQEVLDCLMAYEVKHNYSRVIRAEKKAYLIKDESNKEIEFDKIKNKEKEIERQIKIHKELYKEVLENRPWEKCDCKICKEIGIEVMIFRGNNRNRRRGFHNTYIFYKQKQLLLSSM